MLKLLLTSIALSITHICSFATEPADIPLAPSTIAQTEIPALSSLRAGHPRLIFTPELEARLRQRAANDPLLTQLIAKTRARSDEIAASPPVPFETVPFNDGIQMLSVSRSIQERVVVHGFMYRYTGERKYADRLWREMESALNYPTWNPGHFLDASEMTMAVAFAYDWGYDAWTPEQRERLRTALKTRSLQYALNIYETRKGSSGFFVTTNSNWNSVCNAGLMAAVLAIAEDEPALAQRVLNYAIPSLSYPRSNFASGSAYDEGQSYWSYSVDYFMLASQLLSSAFGNDGGLANDHVFPNAAPYRLYVRAPSGINYTYSDSWRNSNSHFGYAILANRSGSQQVNDDVRYEFTRYLDVKEASASFRLYPLAYLFLPAADRKVDSSKLPLDAFYRGTVDLAMLRGAWDDPKAAYVGFKAGHVDHNHNHLDAGSFIFDSAGVRWSSDLGPESYSVPNYFRKESSSDNPINPKEPNAPNRWTYYRVNNYGHSTLTLGGALQSRTAVAPFIATGSTPRFAFSVADLSSIYPGQAREWKRGVALVDRQWLVVRDELHGLKKGVSADWGMMTEATVTVAPDGRSATLTRDGEKLKLVLEAAPASARITAAPALPPTKEETQNDGITRISIKWNVDKQSETIEVHLVPTSFKGKDNLVGTLAQWSKSQKAK